MQAFGILLGQVASKMESLTENLSKVIYHKYTRRPHVQEKSYYDYDKAFQLLAGRAYEVPSIGAT